MFFLAILKTLSKSNVKYSDQILSLAYFTDQILRDQRIKFVSLIEAGRSSSYEHGNAASSPTISQYKRNLKRGRLGWSSRNKTKMVKHIKLASFVTVAALWTLVTQVISNVNSPTSEEDTHTNFTPFCVRNRSS